MINVIEATALAAVEPLLPAGHQSLGIHLDVRHFAATPIGMRVYATAELVGLDGRTLTFGSRRATTRSRSAAAPVSAPSSTWPAFDERVKRKLAA
jgi:fluoroacetyl-CoA thioesterase